MGCCGNRAVADSNEFKVHPDDGFAGPLKERRCTDVCCLLVLVAFLIGMLAVFGLALSKGDINRILNGIDSFGNVCGRKNEKIFQNNSENGGDMSNKPYLRRKAADDGPFMDLRCTEKCEDDESPFFKRCLPKNISIDGTVGVKFTSPVGRSSFFRQATSDLQYCWREIVYLCLIAFGVTIIITVMLRFLAAVIIYVAMVLMIIVSIAGTAYVWYRFYQAKQKEQKNADPYYKTNSRNWLIGAIISTVFCILFLITMWVLRKRLKLVIALFKEAGKAIAAMPFILIQPFWTFLFILIICALWFYCILWMQTYGSFVEAGHNRIDFRVDTLMKVMRWYYAFGLLWLVWFCFGCQHCVIAGAIASWFFTRDKSQLGTPIIKSTGRVIRYHLGSIAFGSLIIAIIKFIRIIVNLLKKQAQSSRNPVAACCFQCIQCCLGCIDQCIKFIARNAYIEIAIYGYNFCKAARKAFHIITSNSLRIAAINSVGDFTLFISKMLVVIAVAFIGMEMIRAKQGVTHVWLPVLIASLFAYFIADCFLSVYEMTIDTLFICFCEDCERNDGINRPYFMSSSLMKFVEDGKKSVEYM